ncbi:hypothetical protein GGI01_003756 [Coemansia sp. RSA 376]|nr:hypothetical protein H4S03_005873 [Coemansia sp. S3946]KAJ2042197.1 hypothetical protein H4S04_007422 [Coemansia sp. S16]KAJ2043358.1 hypothetical protein GGI08_007435 [Coemansia sp. S2]KAJ2111412.1 hypothetical protein IW146_005369 [Coemansia sp. RSA 922]KAJ2259194.1 hypothetical protein GGI01_003756 [Coemansia sp. RSA 376]
MALRHSVRFGRMYHTERHSSLRPVTWIISDGNVLNDYKATRIASALQTPYEVKNIFKPRFVPPLLHQKLTNVRALLQPDLSGPLSHVEDTVGNDDLPQLAIATSNNCLPALLEIKQRTRGQSISVYLGLPDVKLAQIDALVFSRFDQMRLRYLGPARANLENAISTLLPFSGALMPHPQGLAQAESKRTVVVCIGSGVEPAGFKLQTSDIDILAEGLEHTQPEKLCVLLSPELSSHLKSKVHTLLVNRLRHNSSSDVEVVDYSLPGQPSPVDIIASASLVVATADDIPSVSLAVSLHRPVYIAGEERTTNILRNYYQVLDASNLVRRFYPKGSRYSYMVMSDISGDIDEYSALRDHEPWTKYDSHQDLSNISDFIRQRIKTLNK